MSKKKRIKNLERLFVSSQNHENRNEALKGISTVLEFRGEINMQVRELEERFETFEQSMKKSMYDLERRIKELEQYPPSGLADARDLATYREDVSKLEDRVTELENKSNV
jgi:polyhydroxyalkanoate synthesis regulator phasin